MGWRSDVLLSCQSETEGKVQPVHLFTAASPLRNDQGVVVGVLLVTRDVTTLKQAQLAIERKLQEKTDQLLEVESGAQRIASALQRSSPGDVKHPARGGLHSDAFLSGGSAKSWTCFGGARSRSIAQKLGISIETVRRHMKAMFRKTGVHSQDALVSLFSDTREQL